MSLKSKAKQSLKHLIAMFLVIIIIFGIVPIELSASAFSYATSNEWAVTGVTPIQGRFFSDSQSIQARIPYIDSIQVMDRGFAEEANVFMGGNRVSSIRYVVVIDGVEYEGFCTDPHLPGPETSGAIYVPAGEAPALYNVLRYGFRANPHLGSEDLSFDQRVTNAYLTRVAVAMANHPDRTFTGDPATLQAAQHLVNGTYFRPAYHAADFANTLPAIAINGVRHAEDLNRVVAEEIPFAQSIPFNLTHNLRTNSSTNPFRFEWDASTPAGARLVIDGSTYVAPNVPDRGFTVEPNFTLELPNEPAFEGQQAKVHLVGIHNQHAGRVWRLQNHVSPHLWQDVVFYIPEIHSTAVFSFNLEPEPGDRPGNGNGNGDSSVRIQKICAITRENIPGALMRLQGMSSHQVVTGDGQMWEMDNTGINASQVLTAGATTALPSGVTSTVTDGVWTLTGLPYGFYMVSEERAPQGFSMYPQHTAFGFWVLPPNVHIDSPDGLVYNIVERAPNESHILITFENYPFSEVVVYKREVSNGVGNNQLLAGATFRIQGYYPGNPAIPIDRVATTGADGRVVFSDLPAGHFTISEIQPPTGYLLGDYNVWTVNIGWGQTVAAGTTQSHTFFNVPKSSLEILKVCGVTNEPLQGAIFELYDPTTGESWQATSGADGIAIIGRGNYGNFLYPNRTLILREVVAPTGFVLSNESREIILSPGDENRVTWRNWRNPGLTIIKECQDTGERLVGAHFTIEAQGSGRPLPKDFPMITDENGEIRVPWTLFEGENERVFRITETVPPPGFSLSDPNWQLVTLQAGYDNTVVFSNRRMPDLTIQKRDAITGEPIANAEFTIERLDAPNAGMLTGNPFRTNAQGQIVIPGLAPGVYRIIETRAANHYWLDPNEANRTWTITIRDNENYTLIVENTLLPTLIITKMNQVTFLPVPMTRFLVELEVPNTGNVVRIGEFITDSNGQIILPFVQPGWYRITETHPAPGMSLNVNNSYRVFLSPGQNTYQLLAQMPNLRTSDTPHDGQGNNPHPQVTPPNPVEPTNPEMPPNWNDMTDDERADFARSGLQVTGGDAHLTGENIWNWPLNSIVIKKANSVTGELLKGATFEVVHTSAGVSGTMGTVIGRYTTDHSGIIVLTGLIPGSYVVREVVPPTNFTLSVNNSQTVHLMPDGHSVVEVVFDNDPYGSLLISKRCSVTGVPLANAEFRVVSSSGAVVGTANGLFRTNAQGEVLIPNLSPDSYVVTEVRSPDGFILDSTPQTIRVNATGQVYRLEFTNTPLSNLIIRKVSEYDSSALAGAVFEVRRPNGEYVGTFTTGSNGSVEVPEILGHVVITEKVPPPGHSLATNNVRAVEVRPGAPTVVEFVNPRLPSIAIRKISGDDGRPLAGVVFEITSFAGERIRNPRDNSFEFVTDSAGMIFLPQLPPGTFIARETRSLPGYRLAELYTFVVENNQDTMITIRNYKMPSVVIRKICGDTGRPLPGVAFEIARYLQNGRTGQRLKNYAVDNSCEFVTDASGHIYLPTLEDGLWAAIETRQLPGFRNDNPMTTFRVGENGDHTVIIRNYRYAELTIQKVNSVTRRPLEGVHFEISRPDGTRVVNPSTGFHTFITDNRGLIHLPELVDGRYYLHETRALPGFIIDEPVIAFNIDSSARQREHVLTVENRPASGLLIIKTCAQTGNPLQGVEFEVRHADGRLVTGQIQDGNQPDTPANSPNLTTANGRFVTDSRGRIYLNHLPAGVFHVTETRALDGFELDTTVHVVTITPGGQYVLRVENTPLSGLRILKLCSVTRNPIYNVEFMVFDENNHVVGVFYTDNRGIIDFPAILVGGRYTIRETRPAPGFSLDTMPRTVEFVPGRVTEIVWYNVPIAGQLQITKVSADFNQQNALPAGTPLQGAIFEIFEHRTGNLVDRIVSNERGLAISKPLPLGRYFAVEVQAPAFYQINPQRIDFDIEHERQIVRVTFPNWSANTGVSIRKTGPAEVMQGQLIAYEIPLLRNDSNIPLADFFWRDILPTNAVRVNRLVTGTFNAPVTYRIIGTTNTGREIVIADNLQSTRNNVIEMLPVSLGLAANEYLTEFTVLFGQVPAGFMAVEAPRVFVDVIPSSHTFLPNGMMFANRVDVGGRVPGSDEWVIGGSTSSSIVANLGTPPVLPRSGW